MTQTGEKYNWISSVPYGWKLVKLKYLSSISTGVYDTQDKLEDGAFPFFVRSPHVERIDKYSHDCEAVMTAGDGVGVGKVFHYYNGKFAAHQRVYVFNQFKNNVNGKYIYYSLMSNLKLEVLQGNAKSTVDSLRYPMLSNFPILLPSSSTQNIIVDFLERKTSEIDTLISDKEKLIALLEEKRQAIITEAVTKGLEPAVKMKNSGVEWIGEIPEHWDMKKIKRVISIQNGREILEEVTEESTDHQKYRVYGSGGFFKWTNDYLYNGESVLFGRKGTLGKPLYINGPFWTVDTMYYSKMKKAKAKYIYFVLLAFPWNIITTQTALPSIVSTDLGNESWCFPSIKEQDDIITYLDKIDEETTGNVGLLKRQIELLREYRQALIYEAVTGKIGVQEIVRETEHEEVSSS